MSTVWKKCVKMCVFSYMVLQLGKISWFQVWAAVPMLSSILQRSSSCFFLFCASFSSTNMKDEEMILNFKKRKEKHEPHESHETSATWIRPFNPKPFLQYTPLYMGLFITHTAIVSRLHSCTNSRIFEKEINVSLCPFGEVHTILWDPQPNTQDEESRSSVWFSLTSLLGLGHHLFILLSVLLSLLLWLGRQITVTQIRAVKLMA